jgi:hypothetical protein
MALTYTLLSSFVLACTGTAVMKENDAVSRKDNEDLVIQ